MGGSIVDNLHGWITCGQCPRVDHVWKFSTGGPHVDSWSRVEHMWTEGISPEIDKPIRNRHTKLYGVRVDSCGERGSKTTLLHILSTCPRVHTWLSCVITVWSHGFSCALHVLFVRREICNLLPHGFRP